MSAADKQLDKSEMNIYQKLATITGEVGAVAKGGRNKEQNYDFIEYAAVAGELRGLFAKYGVLIIPSMQKTSEQRREEITSKYGAKGVAVLIDFEYKVVNADKPDDFFTVNWTGEAADYGDKATNKAATSALKYYLMRQFNISEKGEDPDAASPDRSAGTVAIKTPPKTNNVAENAKFMNTKPSDFVDFIPEADVPEFPDLEADYAAEETPEQLLTRAKGDINDMMNEQGIDNPVKKKSYVSKILKKSTIDSIDDARKVREVLEGVR